MPTGNEPPPGWEHFWAVYPRKVDKKAALKAWTKLAPDSVLIDRIIAAVGIHKTTDEWNQDGGKFVPYPASWLNGRRWEDEVKPGRYTKPTQVKQALCRYCTNRPPHPGLPWCLGCAWCVYCDDEGKKYHGDLNNLRPNPRGHGLVCPEHKQ